jgi:hypothetical protein
MPFDMRRAGSISEKSAWSFKRDAGNYFVSSRDEARRHSAKYRHARQSETGSPATNKKAGAVVGSGLVSSVSSVRAYAEVSCDTAQSLARQSLVGLRGDYGGLSGLLLLRRRCLDRVAAAGIANHDRCVFIGSGGVRDMIVAREHGRGTSEKEGGEENGRLHERPLKWRNEHAP